MFAALGKTVIKVRWLIVAMTVAIYAVGAAWGTGLFDDVSDGGFVNPDAPSVVATERITETFGSQDADVIVLYSSPDLTVEDPQFAVSASEQLDLIAALPEVSSVTSYFNTGAEAFVSTEGNATFATIGLSGGSENELAATFDSIKHHFAADGLDTALGGGAAIFHDINTQVQDDLITAELFSLPLLLLIMVLVFGALVAASMPLMIAGMAILGGFTVTRIIAQFTDVSIFAVNVITIIGLGMSIDYSLFVLKRFREELAAGRDKRTAVLNTVATAGRTVGVSGLIIILSMVGLLFVPLPFLHGIAYGVMAAVGVAMLGAMVVLPAVLYLLGHRVDKLAFPWTNKKRATDTGFWSRVGDVVMRRPVFVLVGVTALLALMASPVLSAAFGGVDERVLPAGTESRTVTETLASDFPGGHLNQMSVMLDGGTENILDQAVHEISLLRGVHSVQPVNGNGEATLLQVSYDLDPFSAQARDLASDLRELDLAGTEVIVAGGPAELTDTFEDILDNLPYMAAYVVGITMLLLFFAFGSIILPIKAVLMNFISLAAAIGVVVWIFQDGNLSTMLGFDASGYLEPSNIILMAVILFALSTDYEVFLLSRVREEWDNGADNRTAVLRAMQRTGGIITAAAAVLIVVVGAITFSGVVFMKMLGLGMALAIFLDATVVRMLLVPSTMRLLGRANWWVPGPLAKLYAKYGLKEGPDAPIPSQEGKPELVSSRR
ncbi:MMPL family transporter [Natronoglycomyces albus]|uniref:MMPL family transporter n=2 Tax=Natronoglycomyces albus TaxID=2811108 RepID=A0A895XTJ0_9ACTN|nr:MMPL family transporter [Natronoglycomyces albus]